MTLSSLSILLSIVIAFLIAILSYQLKFLSFSGSFSTFILATLIFGFGGLKWSVPIFTFFVFSSILSKVRFKKNQSVDLFFEKNHVRDYLQVLANGGISGILVLIHYFTQNELMYFLYLAFLSSVCADTWATEFGTWKKTKTYNILNFTEIEQGMSGGISLIGTLGALSGTFAISLSGVFWINLNLFYYFLMIIISGLFGSFVDSFLGATIQLQKKCIVCNKITERNYHCGKLTKFYRGIKWINNDLVNFISGLIGSIVFYLLSTNKFIK